MVLPALQYPRWKIQNLKVVKLDFHLRSSSVGGSLMMTTMMISPRSLKRVGLTSLMSLTSFA